MASTTVNFASNAAPQIVMEQTPYVYAVRTVMGNQQIFGDGDPSFVVRVPSRDYWAALEEAGAYRVAAAFVRGDFDVDGDLLQAIRWWEYRHQGRRSRDLVMWALGRLRPESWFQSVGRARQNVRFHYDRSNLFYQQFLDRQLVYSCAYFTDPSRTLEEAQTSKLDHICRKLDMRRNDHLLDIGSGWGALVFHASERYEAQATGCTLSTEQFDFAQAQVMARNLSSRVRFYECDYRDIRGRFSKIASVGMFEHVGRRRLGSYFLAVSRLLADDGLFLNHGIVRPYNARDGASTMFLQRRVFPGGELPYLPGVLEEAERAGFEVLDVENLRPHYALTCAAWVHRLRQHRNACLSLVDAETYRTWLLYLASAAVSFELARTDIYQILLAKRGAPASRRLTRAYMYGTAPSPTVTLGAAEGISVVEDLKD